MFHVKHSSKEIEKILAQSAAWGFEVPHHRAQSLVRFASILEAYEEANVIGAKAMSVIVEDHILDALSCLLFEPLRQSETLVDVGSGGGLPGVPIGITLEALRVSLVEATAKKVRFLEVSTRQLGLKNVRVLNQRVEEVGRSEEFRGHFDAATARAVASLDVLAEYCLPLVKVGGYVVAMKGRAEKEEIRKGEYAARIMGGEISDVIPVSRLPEHEQKQRNLIVFTKTAETPGKYPRRIGTPAKKPLGEIGNA